VQHCASYDSQAGEWLWVENGEGRPPELSVAMRQTQLLRYGENVNPARLPHSIPICGYSGCMRCRHELGNITPVQTRIAAPASARGSTQLINIVECGGVGEDLGAGVVILVALQSAKSDHDVGSQHRNQEAKLYSWQRKRRTWPADIGTPARAHSRIQFVDSGKRGGIGAEFECDGGGRGTRADAIGGRVEAVDERRGGGCGAAASRRGDGRSLSKVDNSVAA
jgi:hypothetical protein